MPNLRRAGGADAAELTVAHRRQGHGRAVPAALLGWFDEAGITRVDLRATSDGRALHERAGSAPLGGPVLSRVSRP